jgi:predicted aldo/keto reductase-like oxidoreductase
MLYRELGSTGIKVSILGYGCMRLPTKGQYGPIDKVEATKALDYAIDHGVNYLDTAYPYHGNSFDEGGESEVFLGEYLEESGRREEIHLATKLPVWLLEDTKDMDIYLENQLRRLQTDQIEFYLLHSVKEKHWFNLEDMGIFEFLDSAREDGRIKYVGFSSHDETHFFQEVLDAYEWDLCQFQYNYLDINVQAGYEGLKYADEKGVGVVVMEPLKGGILVQHTPPEVEKVWEKAPKYRKPVEWAFRYLWDIPQVDLVLSGMSNLNQVIENIEIAKEGYPNSLIPEEQEIMETVQSIYHEKIMVDCSACGYCMPCPSGINIPKCLSYLNQAAMLHDKSEVEVQYFFMLNETERASNCIECGLCVEICTQKIQIPEMLKEVKKLFGE